MKRKDAERDFQQLLVVVRQTNHPYRLVSVCDLDETACDSQPTGDEEDKADDDDSDVPKTPDIGCIEPSTGFNKLVP